MTQPEQNPNTHEGAVSLVVRVERAADSCFAAASKDAYDITRDVLEGNAKPEDAAAIITRAYSVAIEHSILARNAILAPFAEQPEEVAAVAAKPKVKAKMKRARK